MHSLRLSPRVLATTLAAAAVLATAAPAAAQFRPLEPLDWRALGTRYTAEVGGGVYTGQRASLAGTSGRLLELGTFRASWNLDRVTLEIGGTALWLFHEESVFADPLGEIRPAHNGRRVDTGDYRVSTVVQLTHPGSPTAVALRFGVRLPTTDNLQGLGRDATDFFSTVAGRWARGPMDLSGELGLGINGTRYTHNEQVDVLLFGLTTRYVVMPKVAIQLQGMGQHDTRPNPEWRGNEDLGEARAGVVVGQDRWIAVSAVRGWTPASPDLGLVVQLGTRF
jgi:hypothetical protein